MRKPFSAGARIAMEDANNLFTSLSNIKAMQKQSAKSRKVRRPCYETYDSSDPTSVGLTGVHQRASRQQNDWKPPARRGGGRVHRVGETAGRVAARSVHDLSRRRDDGSWQAVSLHLHDEGGKTRPARHSGPL